VVDFGLFGFVKIINAVRKKLEREKPAPAPAAPAAEILLLTEIRDALKDLKK
jgi:large conductance mechanosensitive channel